MLHADDAVFARLARGRTTASLSPIFNHLDDVDLFFEEHLGNGWSLRDWNRHFGSDGRCVEIDAHIVEIRIRFRRQRQLDLFLRR